MKAAGALLVLLLCLFEDGAQGERGALNERYNNVEPGILIQPDLSDEVNQLRDMVHSLGNTVAVQGEKLKTMEAKVTASEGEVQELQHTVAVQGEKLKTMEAKVTASEGEVQELRDTVVVQGEKLRSVEEEAMGQRDLVSDLRVELGINKHEMEGMLK